jgi:hypothetical protein
MNMARLLNLNRNGHDLMLIIKLYSIFEIMDEETVAIRSSLTGVQLGAAVAFGTDPLQLTYQTTTQYLPRGE